MAVLSKRCDHHGDSKEFSVDVARAALGSPAPGRGLTA
uniref:Uncharacterized protein n=1 Tax=Nonomuraea gerenzanensis TaxID=93944 RepID=A0A1M4EA18_9ACTN|nr:hypothetical protein BN4615_P5110 [Nonomuraea gerenzanensis]